MKRYVVADAASGEILRVVRCADHDAPAQPQAGEVMVEAFDGDWKTHYVLGDQVLAYTPQQIADKAARPSTPSRWDNTTMSWVDVRSLAEIKADKIALFRERARAEDMADIVTQAGTFPVNENTRGELAQELALAAADGGARVVELEDGEGNPVERTAAEIKWALDYLSNRSVLLRRKLRAKIAEIEAAATKAQVRAITWN